MERMLTVDLKIKERKKKSAPTMEVDVTFFDRISENWSKHIITKKLYCCQGIST